VFFIGAHTASSGGEEEERDAITCGSPAKDWERFHIAAARTITFVAWPRPPQDRVETRSMRMHFRRILIAKKPHRKTSSSPKIRTKAGSVASWSRKVSDWRPRDTERSCEQFRRTFERYRAMKCPALMPGNDGVVRPRRGPNLSRLTSANASNSLSCAHFWT
jgi:hypothetical protein